MPLLKKTITDIKTYYKIHHVYHKRYPDSIIESYIVNESILGKGVLIKQRVILSAALKQLGNYTYIGANTQILNCKEIGNFCSISHDVKIGLDNHALDHISTSPIFYSPSRKWVKQATHKADAPTIIGADVLISANVNIMSGVSIGTGAVIGANSFVNKDVPPYAIVAGIPAKIIKYRFDENTIARLLKSEWWCLDKTKLMHYADIFNNVPNFLEKITL